MGTRHCLGFLYVFHPSKATLTGCNCQPRTYLNVLFKFKSCTKREIKHTAAGLEKSKLSKRLNIEIWGLGGREVETEVLSQLREKGLGHLVFVSGLLVSTRVVIWFLLNRNH